MKTISTKKAPEAIGPYSQAIQVGNFMYLSGQIGLNPETMKLVEGIKNQSHQVCKNIGEILKSQSLDYGNIIKTTIFLKNIDDFSIINDIYGNYFSHKPARSTVEVSNLPKSALIEIDCIAFVY